MKKEFRLMALLCILPAATLVLAFSYQYWAAFESEKWFNGYVTFISGAAAAVSIFSIGLAAYTVFDRRRMEARSVIEESERRAGTLHIRLAEQAREIEILAAMREVGLIVTREVNFEKILAGVLEVVEGLFQSESIAVFLPETPVGGKGPAGLAAKALRRNGKTLFGTDVLSGIDCSDAEKAYTDRMPAWSASGGILDFAVPLIADEEILGVMKIAVPAEQSGPSEGDEVREIEKKLVKVVRHIALAIKTPTLYDRAVIDGLTRLYTKRHFSEAIDKLFNQSARTKKPVSLIMIDLDYFKNINDTHGHLFGDVVLAGVAGVIKSCIRKYDTAYRYGGEEMSVLLPEASTTQALRVARRIRKTVEEAHFTYEAGEAVPVTVSCGVASWIEKMDGPEALIKASDQALYTAKKNGRNRVISAKQAGSSGTLKKDAGKVQTS